MNSEWDDVPRDALLKEMRRLHRQRIMLACAVRANFVHAGIKDVPGVIDIIRTMGDLSAHANIERLTDNGWYVEMSAHTPVALTNELTHFLSEGGIW